MTGHPRRIGLLGGTFDPPHLGHLVVAEIARVRLSLSDVLLLVAGDPWMKKTSSSPEHRVAMARLAVADHPSLHCDDREVRRSGPTYTADTLEELTEEDPDASFVFLLGSDALEHLPSWKRVRRALELGEFVAVRRPGTALVRDDPLQQQVGELTVPQLDISSTDLRERFARGDAVRFQLPRAVEEYVRREGLYGAGDEP